MRSLPSAVSPYLFLRLRLVGLFLFGIFLASVSPGSARAAYEPLDAPGVWDLLHDDQRNLLYLSTRDGEVLRYDLDAGAFLTSIRVGERALSELTISPDRTSLVVVERAIRSARPAPDWTGLFSIDLDSLVVSRVVNHGTGLDFPAFDALFLADGSLLISTIPRRRPYAPVPVYRFDPTTEQYSVVLSTNGPALLTLSQDRQVVLMSTTVEIPRGSVDSTGVRTALYEPATGNLRTRVHGGGFSPAFLQDSDAFAMVSGIRPNLLSNPNTFWTWVTSTNSFSSRFSVRSFGDPFFSRDALSIAWAPNARRIYSSWKGSAGAAVVVHSHRNPSRPPLFLGFLDASTSAAGNNETGGYFGRIRLLPDESKLFVATPDAIRVYNPLEFIDSDQDGVSSRNDNCPNIANPEQRDLDRDGLGDACNERIDRDGDERADGRDNCPTVPNPSQLNFDRSRFGNACNDHEDGDGDDWGDFVDNCPNLPNDQANQDGDRFGDACDIFPFDSDHVLAQIRLERDDARADAARLSEELSLLSSELAICLNPPDADGDGLLDGDDLCPNSEPGAVIDSAGCSKSQFCEEVAINGWADTKRCVSSVWTGPSNKGHQRCRLRWRNRQVRCAAEK